MHCCLDDGEVAARTAEGKERDKGREEGNKECGVRNLQPDEMLHCWLDDTAGTSITTD